MEVAQKTETCPPTPEQLLKLLELQLARERGKRGEKTRKRATFLVAGILFIVAAMGIALVVAQSMVAELKERGALRPISSQPSEVR
jgi:predicted metal-binding membrane protein